MQYNSLSNRADRSDSLFLRVQRGSELSSWNDPTNPITLGPIASPSETVSQ